MSATVQNRAGNDRGAAPAALSSDAADEFRLAMRELTSAVCVVTAGRGRTRCGLTASSVASLSLAPASLMVCIQNNSGTLARILDDDAFAVNILSARQRDIACDFAGYGLRTGLERFDGPVWIDGLSGVPILSSSLAVVECRVGGTMPWHTHVVVAGLVTHVRVHGPQDPLVYWRGGYRDIAPPPAKPER